MTDMFEFDADAARKVEAVYSTADVIRQREAVLAAVDVMPGDHALDVGVDPGFWRPSWPLRSGPAVGCAGSTSATTCWRSPPGVRFDLAPLGLS